MRFVTTLLVLAAAAACGGEVDTRAVAEEAARGEASATRSPASSSPTDLGAEDLLCDRIDDDEALAPAGAEPLEHPGVEAANSEKRCMRVFGVDMPIAEVRRFYRSRLPELGYEIVRDEEMEGMMSGNLGRTFIRATKPDRQVHLTIDEFEPEAPLSEHRVNVRMQLDAVGRQ